MIVEIISVGTELLMGNIVNTNAHYIANRLAHLGLEAYYQTVVGDNAARLKSVLDIAFSRGDLAVITGGLGPTKDDLTKEMLMEYFHKKPVEDAEVMSRLIARAERNHTELTEGIKKQAIVPADSIILYNDNGTAPGCIMEDNGKGCILLPGPPREMKPMFEKACNIFLRHKSDKVLISYNIKLLTMQEASVAATGEAFVAERLGSLLDGKNPTVATYAKQDGCLVRVTVAAKNRSEGMEMLKPILEQSKKAIGEEYIRYIEEDAELEE